jgi:inosose dehydratase
VLKPLMAASAWTGWRWFSGNLLAHDVDAEIAARRTTCSCSRPWARTVFVHAETSNAIHGQMRTPLARHATPDAAGWSCSATG